MSEQHMTTVEENLANSIAMLEQILEVMPQDADALRAVYSAYRKIGEDAQAFDYLNRIIEVYLGGGDRSLKGFIAAELAHYENVFPSEVSAQNARMRIATDSSTVGLDEHGSYKETTATSAKHEADIGEELALAWRLYEESQLSQEEYSSVLHDLTEVSSKDLDVPVSVLHVLHDRGFTQMNRVMNYLSNRSGVPCIQLTGYEFTEDVSTALPFSIPEHEGALPFAFLGNDLLVAVLNPYNNLLVDKVESVSGNRCHTYLVDPEDYDMALGRLRTMVGKSTPRP